MPKRSCPFESDLLPQLKVYIGQKEYDIQDACAMSKIYDKTWQKLFKASKNLNDKNENIDSNKTNENVTNTQNNGKTNELLDYCVVCNDLNIKDCKCNFCDKWMCHQCSTECVKCYNFYCPLCSYKLYSKNDCDGICLSCSGK